MNNNNIELLNIIIKMNYYNNNINLLKIIIKLNINNNINL